VLLDTKENKIIKVLDREEFVKMGKPMADALLLQLLGCNTMTMKHARKYGYIVYKYVPENSVVVMGGTFQSQMLYPSFRVPF
jgi:hypothetical protein